MILVVGALGGVQHGHAYRQRRLPPVTREWTPDAPTGCTGCANKKKIMMEIPRSVLLIYLLKFH